METKNSLNPQSEIVEIGIRTLRNITLYPLSIGDQLELKDLVFEAIQSFFAKTNQLDSELIAILMDLFTKNIGKIVELATCGEEKASKVLKEITNTQALRIAEVIYAMNYEDVIKNVKSLFQKMTENLEPSASKRPLLTSASTIPDTDLSTSTDETSSVEESPSDN